MAVCWLSGQVCVLDLWQGAINSNVLKWCRGCQVLALNLEPAEQFSDDLGNVVYQIRIGKSGDSVITKENKTVALVIACKETNL